jgi:hypothetical protein
MVDHIVDASKAAGPGGYPGRCGTSSPVERRGQGADRGGVVCVGGGRVGGGAPARHGACRRGASATQQRYHAAEQHVMRCWAEKAGTSAL